MKFAKWLMLVACGLVLVSLAACGTTSSSTTGTSASASGKVNPANLKVALSLGFLNDEAGQMELAGYKASFKEFGITHYTVVNAEYNAATQSQQLQAIVQSKPDVIFMTPSDPVGTKVAVQQATAAGIPVFVSDGWMDGAGLTGGSVLDNLLGGEWSMATLIKSMGGKGNIGLVELASNLNWNERDLGAKYVLSLYPNVHVVQDWQWDSTGVITPTMAIDNMMRAEPKGKLDGIWCAWDGGVQAGLVATKAAGRTEIKFVGFDGGTQALQLLATNPQFVGTVGPATYNMAHTAVSLAMQYLNGQKLSPQPEYIQLAALTPDVVKNATVPAGAKSIDYGMPGGMAKFGYPVITQDLLKSMVPELSIPSPSTSAQ